MGMSTDGMVKYLCVLDFEATCDDKSKVYPQEIIEFPVLLLNTRTRLVEKTFHYYIKPDVNEVLSDFCTELTGITQEIVSQEDTLSLKEVLKRHLEWLMECQLVDDSNKVSAGKRLHSFIYLTCGDWDLKTMLPGQLAYHNIDVPKPLKTWLNIKKEFRNFYKTNPKGMISMLNLLGMELEGRHHSGIDDCHNIARICVKLLEDGWVPKV